MVPIMRRSFWMMGFVLCVVLMAAACRQTPSAPQKFGGTWAMRLGDRTFIVLALAENGDQITGTLTRPEQFQMDGAGSRFSKISTDELKENITTVSIMDDRLRFTTANPKDPSDTSDYELAITGKDLASFKIVDVPFGPWLITRVPTGETAVVSRDWDPQRSYRQEENAVSSLEMQQLYEADQKPRQNPGDLTPAQWDVISRDDAVRRNQTAKLLADGQLHTGEDFNRAALVFQHGSTSNDYLLAHTLAMIAVGKGDDSALWTATATLDRYLQSVGKPQIYGTQFKPGKDASQEPYNRNLISDSLRRELGVPSIAQQVEQFKFFTEQLKTSSKKP